MFLHWFQFHFQVLLHDLMLAVQNVLEKQFFLALDFLLLGSHLLKNVYHIHGHDDQTLINRDI